MANSKSATKRIQIAERNRVRNKVYKSSVRTLMKKFFSSVESYSRQPSEETKQEIANQMATTYSRIDKAVKRGVLHANNGARKKSRLARAFKRASETSTAS